MSDIGYVDQVLTGLKVIGMIKEGHKVNIDDRKRGIFTGFIRWINNDNRYNTLSYIRNVVNNAISISVKNPDQSPLINEGLSRALTGLSALAVTYSDDASVTASIDVMRERIESYKNNM